MVQCSVPTFNDDDVLAAAALREVTAQARAAGFRMVLGLGAARCNQLQRDRERALGRGDADRAAELEALLDDENRRAREMYSQQERERIVPGVLKPGQAVYRGRVTDNGAGWKDLPIDLRDSTGLPGSIMDPRCRF